MPSLANHPWLRRALLAVAVLWGIAAGLPLPQTMAVTLRRAGTPQAGLPVKVVHYGGFGRCDSSGVVGRTDRHGRFSAQRIRWMSALELFVVIVQIDTLCVDLGIGWQPIWSSPYGPASSAIRWSCDLDKPPLSTRNSA